jgi:hypothetical protein
MQLESVVVAAVVPIVVPIVIAGLSRAGARAVAGSGELGYSRVLKWFSLGMALLPPLAVAVAVTLQRRPLRPDERGAVLGLLLFFPALSAPMALEVFRVRHRFDDAGLAFRSPWSRNRRVAFAEVTELRWRNGLKWLDIRAARGDVAHLSPFLSGLEPFARVALRQLPAAVLAACPEGRAALQVMAAGAAGELMSSSLRPEKLLATLRPPGAPQA